MLRLLLLSVLACGTGCGADGDDDTRTEAGAACVPGDALGCACADGARGEALCRLDGTPAACVCAVRRTQPCSAIGAGFACGCQGGGRGEQVCLDSGAYSVCVCQDEGAARAALGAPDLADAGSTPTPAGPLASGGGACPSGYGCVEQMGFTVCADTSGIPPLCTASSACAAAGLPDADCVDPGVGGIQLCVQVCEL